MQHSNSQKHIAKSDTPPPTDMWFTYVVREEVDGSGTKEFIDWFESEGYLEQYAELAGLFTEPTDGTTVEHGHKGNFFIKASINGESAHSSTPSLIKRHAIIEATDFIADIKFESEKWQTEHDMQDFSPSTITPTAIEAKSGSPNKTADHCEIIFDLRTTPNFHTEAFTRIQKLADIRGISLNLLYPEAPAGYTDPASKIIKAVMAIIPDLELKISPASADLGFFTQKGIESVIFGTAEKSQMHHTDEWSNIDKIMAAPALYKQIYEAWASS